jgi:hypothetical protein
MYLASVTILARDDHNSAQLEGKLTRWFDGKTILGLEMVFFARDV